MRTTYKITEYGSFVSDKEVPGFESLPASTFQQLENFVLSNSNKDTDALELMSLSAKKGIGKVITAKNYVGIITMNDGTTIEILPKICSQENYSSTQVKKLLVSMLKTLRNAPFKSLQTTNVSIENLNVFEIFIRMFIDEVFFIVKRGLKCTYESLESNELVYKGKLIVPEQIKRNIAHKEKVYVEFDEYNSNRPENKLIKSTLLYLYKHSSSSKNRNDIKMLLASFSDISESEDYSSDFSKYVPDRNMRDYDTALLWSRVFLQGKSFTSFAGSEVALALLFPMETLFESYVAVQLKKSLGIAKYTVLAQDKTYHLFDEPSKQFLLKPDIVIKRKADNEIFIMDTKWKLLSEAKAHYGISQADMYQMYAYQKKCHAKNVTLLYPMTDDITLNRTIEFHADDDVTVMVKFIDLFNIRECLTSICNELF